MAHWLGQKGEARTVARSPARAEEGATYRAMPLTPDPRRSGRRIVERGLALFNAAALALAVWWVNNQGEPHDYKMGEACIIAGVALGGTIGFLGWFSYGLRLRLILVSGLFWGVIGTVTLLYGLSPYPFVLRLLGREYPGTMGGVVFVAVGLASVAAFRSRERTRCAAGARNG
jgi:hypothetical protein